MSIENLRQIIDSGISAVGSRHLLSSKVCVADNNLKFGDDLAFGLDSFKKLFIFGTGKAGAGMSRGLEDSIASLQDRVVCSRVNVPADCMTETQFINLLAACPENSNKLTADGMSSAKFMLEQASQVTSDDLVLFLISGGGSALADVLELGVSLDDWIAIVNLLEEKGANITELNAVRKQISQFKGGGFARKMAGAKHIVSLMISDVLGDRLDVIASGPTVENRGTAAEALKIIERLVGSLDNTAIPASVLACLQEKEQRLLPAFPGNISNLILGNNQTALDAMEGAAAGLGYHVLNLGSQVDEPNSIEVGKGLAGIVAKICETGKHGGTDVEFPLAIVHGGEPTVKLHKPIEELRADNIRGGRNLDVTLQFGVSLNEASPDFLKRVTMCSVGTDGKDAESGAAGAQLNGEIFSRITSSCTPSLFLAVNDSRTPFAETDSLIVFEEATNTNVADVRLVLIDAP